MLPPGYAPVATSFSRVAHLRHPKNGWACSNGRALEGRGFQFIPTVDIPLCKKCARRQRRPALAAVSGKTPPPWNIAMREILQDGEWHVIQDLARIGGLKVPPNKAMAWFGIAVAPQRSPEWAAGMTPREKIKRGRYNVAIRTITEWITEGVVETDRPPRRKGRRVRLTERPTIAIRDEKGRIKGWK